MIHSKILATNHTSLLQPSTRLTVFAVQSEYENSQSNCFKYPNMSEEQSELDLVSKAVKLMGAGALAGTITKVAQNSLFRLILVNSVVDSSCTFREN